MKLLNHSRSAALCLGLISVVSAWVTTRPISRPRGWLFMSEDGETSEEKTAESSETASEVDYKDKTLYQRVFYRFSHGSDVDVHNAIVVEERVRYQADAANPKFLQPVGHRTLILRDGQVEDGEIGDDLFTLTIDHEGERVHTGAGTDTELESQIATAMYLASNPSLCTGTVLEVACGSGIASLLGCIGAGFISRKGENVTQRDVADDILTIGSAERDGLLPDDLEKLTLTDSDETSLNAAFHNCKHSGIAPSKVHIERLDWKARAPIRNTPTQEYRTVVASDVAFSYPEAKELARIVANRLAPLSETVPRFIHVCPDSREDTPYLHRLLNQGYRMSVSTGYLKLEKLMFLAQSLPQTEPESALDDLELELADFREIYFQSMMAQHHPDYVGGGSGELFFPIATGEYEMRSESTYMEPDTESSSPW